MLPLIFTLLGAVASGVAGIALLVKARRMYRHSAASTTQPEPVPVKNETRRQKRKKKREQRHQPSTTPQVQRPRLLTFPLVAGIACCALSTYLFHDFATAPRTPEQKAAAQIMSVLRKDASVRLSAVDNPVQPGSEDNAPSTFERRELSGQQMSDAQRIITAVTENDLQGLQSVLSGYANKPYAAAEIASSLRRACHTLETDFVFYTNQSWFYIGKLEHHEGDFELVLSLEGKRARVLKWVRRNGDYAPQIADEVDPAGVLQQFQQGIVQAVQRHQAFGK